MPHRLYLLHELESETGVPARTLRQWIHQRLVPKPLGRGRAARYTEGHLLHARAVAHLRASRLSLRAIRARIANLTEEQLRALAPAPPAATAPDGVPATPPPEPSYPSLAFELVELMPGLWLMVDTRRGPGVRRVADSVYRHYAVTSAPARG